MCSIAPAWVGISWQGKTFDRSTAFVTLVVAIGIFADVFLYAVLLPVLPFSLVDHVRLDEGDAQRWISILLGVYGATSLLFSPLCGFLSDRLNSRRPFLVLGIVLLAAGVSVISFVNSLPVLVLGRVLQGLSSAISWVVGLAMLVETYGEKSAGRAMGFVTLAFSVGYGLGPVLGGIVYAKTGLNGARALMYVVLAVDGMGRLALLNSRASNENGRGRNGATRVDGAASAVEVAMSTPNLWLFKTLDASDEKPRSAASKHHSYCDNSVAISRPPVVYAARRHSAPVKVTDQWQWQEFRPSSKTLQDNHVQAYNTALQASGPAETQGVCQAAPTRWARIRRCVAAFCGVLVATISLTAIETTLPIFVYRTFDWGALRAGLIMIPLVVPCVVGGPPTGALADKHGVHWFGILGLALCCPAWFLLRLVEGDNVGFRIALLVILLLLIGASYIIATTALLAEFGVTIPGYHALSYGLMNVALCAGLLSGAFWSGLLVDSAGWAAMTTSIGGLCTGSVLVLLFLWGNPISSDPRRWLAGLWLWMPRAATIWKSDQSS